jgi:hypothetical protein
MCTSALLRGLPTPSPPGALGFPYRVCGLCSASASSLSCRLSTRSRLPIEGGYVPPIGVVDFSARSTPGLAVDKFNKAHRLAAAPPSSAVRHVRRSLQSGGSAVFPLRYFAPINLVALLFTGDHIRYPVTPPGLAYVVIKVLPLCLCRAFCGVPARFGVAQAQT